MDYEYLRASDGTGKAAKANIQTNRAVGSTVLDVDNVAKWPTKFICTTGTIGANGYMVESSMTEFRGRIVSGDIIIDKFEPGFTDIGNTAGQVAIVKQATGWANAVADHVVPTGAINQFAGATAPTDWLLCDGAAVSRTTYADLFVVLGTTYGSGDGSTTFNIPNLKGRVPVGRDTAQTEFDVLGETGGAKTHTLTTAEMPSHTHTDGGHYHGDRYNSASGGNTGYNGTLGNETGLSTKIGFAALSNTGDGGAHNNLQPYIALNYIIKA